MSPSGPLLALGHSPPSHKHKSMAMINIWLSSSPQYFLCQCRSMTHTHTGSGLTIMPERFSGKSKNNGSRNKLTLIKYICSFYLCINQCYINGYWFKYLLSLVLGIQGFKISLKNYIWDYFSHSLIGIPPSPPHTLIGRAYYREVYSKL